MWYLSNYKEAELLKIKTILYILPLLTEKKDKIICCNAKSKSRKKNIHEGTF